MDILLPGTGLLFWSILSIFFLILPLLALIILVRLPSGDGTTKLIWLLIILFVPLAGTLLFFAIGRKQVLHKN